MRSIVAALAAIDDTARWRPLLLTAIFTGLRASELRGLKWADVDLKRNEIHVRQRADRYGKIGRTKSEAGERTVPLLPMVVNVLREHRLACTNGSLGLAFPNSKGSIEHRNTIVERGLHPAQMAAGVVKQGRTASRSPSILACTRSAISMRRGASIAASMVAWNYRSRWCKRG